MFEGNLGAEMRIELFGVPGSGKSTWMTNYSDLNGVVAPLELYLYNDSRIKRNLNKLFLCIYYFIRNRNQFLKFWIAINDLKFSSFKIKIKMFVYLISTVGAISKSEKFDSIVIDEGVSQVLWGICYNTIDKNPNDLKNLITNLVPYFMNRLIFIKADKEVIYERLMQRSGRGGSEVQHDIVKNKALLEEGVWITEQILKVVAVYFEDIEVKSFEEN